MKRKRRTVRRPVRRKKEGKGGTFLIIILILAALILLIKIIMPEKLDEFKEKIFKGLNGKNSITESVAAFGKKLIGSEAAASDNDSKTAFESVKLKEFPANIVSELALEALSAKALVLSEESHREYMNDDAAKEVVNLQSEYTADGIQNQIFSESISIDGSVCRPTSGTVSASFGYCEDNDSKIAEYNYGIDISAEVNEDIHAFAGGKVVLTAESTTYGLYSVVEHDDGLVSVYANCSDICVSPGDSVKAGDVIGKAGDTGNDAEAFLHFELVKDGSYINPEYFI